MDLGTKSGEDNNSGNIEILLMEIPSLQFYSDLKVLAKSTIENTFYLAISPDTDGLFSSFSKVTTGVIAPGSNNLERLAVAATFSAMQDPSNLFTIKLDASFSYSLWSNHLTFKWDFGDGTTISGLQKNKVSHVYSAAGSFTISLIVTDALGNSAQAKTIKAVTVLFSTTFFIIIFVEEIRHGCLLVKMSMNHFLPL